MVTIGPPLLRLELGLLAKLLIHIFFFPSHFKITCIFKYSVYLGLILIDDEAKINFTHSGNFTIFVSVTSRVAQSSVLYLLS